jgi:Primase C terminal 1 (PriCT-1)
MQFGKAIGLAGPNYGRAEFMKRRSPPKRTGTLWRRYRRKPQQEQKHDAFHAYYRHSGEDRRIRPDPRRPIDLLGGGIVVLRPSKGSKLRYEIIEGTLDDLTALTTLRNVKSPPTALGINPTERIGIGRRNIKLFGACMRHAHHCDDLEALLDVARTRNAEMDPPLDDDEVAAIVASAWQYTERGDNRFGQSGAWLPQSTVQALIRDPALFALIGWLKSLNGPNAEFLVADGLCAPKYLGWSVDRLRDTRRRAIEGGWIVKVRQEVRGVAALYRWGPAAKARGEEC